MPPVPALTQAILAETPPKPQAPAPKVPAPEAQANPIQPKPQVTITVQEAEQPTLPLAAANPAPLPQAKAPLVPGEDQLRATLVAEGSGKGTAAPAAGLEGTLAAPEAALAKLAQPQQGSVLAQPEAGSALAAATSRQAVPAPVSVAPVTAPPAAPPPPPNPPTAQVEGSVRWMLKGGAQEAKLQLHPESLGQVTIHLKVEGGEVHARLWVTEPASVQAVQEGRPHLEQSLKDQGLQLGSFDLQQGQRPFQEAPSAPAFRGSLPSAPVIARQEAPALPAPSILNPHHVELYA
jgi:flagellar hook-length control protein FliK